MTDPAVPEPEPPAAPSSATPMPPWWREVRGLVAVVVLVLAGYSLVAKPFYIPSISMMPTLLVGDRLIVTKYPYGWSWASSTFHVLPRGSWRLFGRTPAYGDVVIVIPRGSRQDYIKRVVALPGDRLAVVEGRIVLNGQVIRQIAEPPLELPVDPNQPCPPEDFPGLRFRDETGHQFCELPIYRETLPNGARYRIIKHRHGPLDTYPEVTIPPGEVFLMGDNRDHSADSRAALVEQGLGGPVPLADIGGRAEMITFSLDGSETWNPMSWWRAMRRGRSGTGLRPDLGAPEPAGKPDTARAGHE